MISPNMIIGIEAVTCTLTLYRAESQAPDQVFLQQKRQDQYGHHSDHAYSGDLFPQYGVRPDQARYYHRKRCNVAPGKDESEHEFVPREDEREERYGDYPGSRQRQSDPGEHLKPRASIHKTGFFYFGREFIEEAFEKPDRIREVERGVAYYQSWIGIEQSQPSEKHEERYG